MIQIRLMLMVGLLSSSANLTLAAHAATATPVLASQSAPNANPPRTRAFMRADFNFCVTRPTASPGALNSIIAACERAYNDPPQANQVALERQSLLLHSKAVWQFCAGDMAAALVTLDRAEALVSGQVSAVYEGSTGLANIMLRALVYGETGRRDQALALLQQARGVRPYALVIQKSIDRLEMRIAQDLDRMPPLTERHLANDPAAAVALFYQHFLNGDLQAAARVGHLAQFGRPILIGGWSLDDKTSDVTRLRDEVEFRYLTAYVYAATGDAAASGQAFADAAQRLDSYVGPEPVPDANRRRVPAWEVEAWRGRTQWAQEMRGLDAPWRRAVDVRAQLAGGASPDILDEPANAALADLPVAHDLMRLVGQMHAEHRAEIEPALARIRTEGLGRLIELSRFDAIELLPETETLATYPRFGRAGDGILIGREAGYSQAPERTGEARTIRFGTRSGSDAAADELVMLAAATYAQREGVDSFLLVGRHLLQRTTRITSWYGLHTNEVDSGSEGSVLAVLIDSNAVPPQWEAHRGRLIRVADVMSSVGTRQQAIEAAKAADSRRR